MKKATSTYRPKNREDNSNPFRKTSHNQLLNKADVHIFKGKIDIQTLENGRIIVKSSRK